jgi:hypothetical protein
MGTHWAHAARRGSLRPDAGKVRGGPSRLIAIGEALVAETGRTPADHEFQLLYGIRPEEQRRIAGTGETVRVYVPYGDERYG